MSLLKVININKYYSEDFSLKNINFNLREGEVHSILGENGSGKTCFMNNICGFSSYDSGSIFLNNIKLEKNKLCKEILFIMQEPNLFDNMTVAENIFFNIYNNYKYTINKNKVFLKCKQVFNELSINIKVYDNVEKLSLSQKQLVEIAKAYVSNCKIIILDEPITTFTDIESEILYNVINYLKCKGIGIIFISHKINSIKKVSDRVSIFSKGEIIACKDVKNLSEEEILKLMASRPITNKYPKINSNIGKSILEIKNLSCENILENISFDLKEGEILGITGLIGSGRTYLSNYLYGAIKKNKIEKIFNEKNVEIHNTFEAIERKIIMLPENREENSIFKSHSSIFNSTISSLNRFTNKNIINENLLMLKVQEYFNKFHITPNKIENDISTFSGGNQQKIILSKLIMTNSLIYILDEPTRGIDIPTKVDIYNCINDIVLKGGAVMFISSDIDELIGMCDRILILESGKIVKEVLAKNVTKEEILKYITMNK